MKYQFSGFATFGVTWQPQTRECCGT